MAGRQLQTFIYNLRRTLGPRGDDTLGDAHLLQRWVQQGDEAAFEILVWRHGAMVLSVCRRLLRDSHDIEDAFQAAFLTLVRKAHSIRRPEALGAWLHQVAYRLALRLRRELAEKGQREQAGVETLTAADTEEPARRDLQRVLDEEIDALPERYRQVFILCCLEGKTHAEAARLLGRPTGTVSCLLKRGRERLRQRLTRRGIAPTMSLAVLGGSEARAALGTALVRSTCRAATGFSTGEGMAMAISPRVAALVEVAVRGMSAAKVHWMLAFGAVLSMAMAGAGMWAYQPPSAKPQAEKQAIEPPRNAESKPPRTDLYGDPLPEGVVARLGTLQLRATRAGVGISADGKTLISIANGRHLHFWDAETGKQRARRAVPARLDGEPFYLSADGRLLAFRQGDFDAPLDLWDVAAEKHLRRLSLPQRQGVYRAKFSPDGKRLAVAEFGTAKPLIRLWDIASGQARELKGHISPADSLAFSPDGKRFAASDGHSVLCWNTDKGEQLWSRKGAFNISLAFTADGRMVIASPGHEERTWHVWDAATGKPADGVKLPEDYNYAELAPAPDGRTLVFVQHRNVTGADGRVRIWDLHTGKLLRTLDGEGLLGPFAPDGRSILVNDGTLQRWELATGRPLLPNINQRGHSKEVMRAVYSADGRRLASASFYGTSVRIWDVASAKPLHILCGHDATDVAFTPDGKLLVSGGTSGSLSVWDTASGKEVRRILLHETKLGEQKQNIWKLHVSPDGQTVITLSYSPSGNALTGILSRWELATGRRKTCEETGPSEGFYDGFSPDGRLLASRGKLLDTASGETRVTLERSPGYLPNYTFSLDGRRIVGLATRRVEEPMRSTTRMDGIRVWDAATGRALFLIPTDWIGQLALSSDGRYLAAADLEGIRLWELATRHVVLRHKAHERMHGSFGSSFASCLSFAPDGRTLATGHADTSILIWNLVPSFAPTKTEDVPLLWGDLIGSDASRAYAAFWRLADLPKETTLFLRERLHPAVAATAEETRPLLADLDNDDFQKREAASTRLREWGDRAAKHLKEALKTRPTLETRRRLEDVLKSLEDPPTGETLRTLRAIAVLERIATPEARAILKSLSEGMAEARVTQEAKASLKHLAVRASEDKR